MQELNDGSRLLTNEEVMEIAEKNGIIPTQMSGSTMKKFAKANKLGDNFEEVPWDDFFAHLEDKKCGVCLMPGSDGYMRIMSNKTIKKLS